MGEFGDHDAAAHRRWRSRVVGAAQGARPARSRSDSPACRPLRCGPPTRSTPSSVWLPGCVAGVPVVPMPCRRRADGARAHAARLRRRRDHRRSAMGRRSRCRRCRSDGEAEWSGGEAGCRSDGVDHVHLRHHRPAEGRRAVASRGGRRSRRLGAGLAVDARRHAGARAATVPRARAGAGRARRVARRVTPGPHRQADAAGVRGGRRHDVLRRANRVVAGVRRAHARRGTARRPAWWSPAARRCRLRCSSRCSR